MNVITARALHEIGNGMKLAIARDGSGAKLIPDRKWKPEADELPISADAATALLESGLLHELTEHGEPPPDQRKRHEGYRTGWREAGLPGEQYRLFVCIQ